MTQEGSIASSTQLIQQFASRAASLKLSKMRSVSAIRWWDDWLVTAADAVGELEAASVALAQGEFSAELVGADRRVDVAVFRVQGVTGKLPRAAFETPQVGAQVALVGRECTHLIAVWGSVRVSGEAWISQRGGRLDRRIELDVRMDSTMEGAAVVAPNAGLLGMSVSAPAEKVLCIPAATIDRVVAAVAVHGRAPQPYLGVRLQRLWLDRTCTEQLGLPAHVRSVAVVMMVEPGSPASSSGVQPGDWLLGLDGRLAPSANEFVRGIGAKEPGDTATLNVHRAGAHQTISARLGDRALP